MKKLLGILVGLLLISNVFAANAPIKEGVDYTFITPPSVTPEPSGKINVKEFFSFVCIHCKIVESLVEHDLANDKAVDLQKIQVVWDEDQTINSLAKLNATISILSDNKLYVPVFNSLFSNDNLTQIPQLTAFLKKNGLSNAEINNFLNTYSSFMVNAKVGEYKKLTTDYKITGTPTFIVADKYMVSPAEPKRLMEVVNYLVNKIKKDGIKKSGGK